MKFRRNVIWLVIWVVLAVAFGLLDAYGYDLHTMPSGVSISRTLTIVFAVLAGYQLGVLTIKGSVKVRRGAPGEVKMLSSLLRVEYSILMRSIPLLYSSRRCSGMTTSSFTLKALVWAEMAAVRAKAAKRVEERLLELFEEGILNGTTHCYIGQEANSVGISHIFGRSSWLMTGTDVWTPRIAMSEQWTAPHMLRQHA